MASEPIFADVPAWPTPKPAGATIGHNKPPVEEEAKAAFREALLTGRPDFEAKLDQFASAADRAKVTDDETYGRAGEFIKHLRAARKHVESAHVAAKQPYLTAGRVVDAEKNALIARLDTAAAKVQPQMNAWAAKKEAEARAERERIAAEQRRLAEQAAAAERERIAAEREAKEAARAATNEAERAAAEERRAAAAEAAEEAMRAAALAPAAASRADPIRSDGGATVSTKQVWNSRVVDYKAAFRNVADDARVREAVDKAVAALVRAGKRDIKGVEVWATAQAVAR